VWRQIGHDVEGPDLEADGRARRHGLDVVLPLYFSFYCANVMKEKASNEA
jgi:hypothetical protein